MGSPHLGEDVVKGKALSVGKVPGIRGSTSGESVNME